VKRLPFLDWLRGLAVVIMIQCHVFNSFVRMDLRQNGIYTMSQFIGGMAAPLFLFMAGMTFAFQLDRLDTKAPSPLARWKGALRRAGYVWVIAYLFRLSNWVGGLPYAAWQELWKVDILNCMGLALTAFSVMALTGPARRVQFAVLGAIAIAGLSPFVAGLDWSGMPGFVREYLVPVEARGRFPFFPCASYVGFGLAAGVAVKRATGEMLERFMQWSVLAGLTLIFAARYFSELPYSIYPASDFWRNSPALIFIRVGITLVLLSISYLCTSFAAGAGWKWMENLGKTSLMVYWVHVMLVYGIVVQPIRRALGIPQTAIAAVLVTALMVCLAELRLRGKRRVSVTRGEPLPSPAGLVTSDGNRRVGGLAVF
jgi:uncharacterized membrane protein